MKAETEVKITIPDPVDEVFINELPDVEYIEAAHYERQHMYEVDVTQVDDDESQ